MTLIVLLFVGLLIGGGGVYVFMSNEYQPIIDDYENQLSDYSSQVRVLSVVQDNLESENLVLKAQSATLENDVSALESDLNYAENQVLKYESDIFSLGTEVSSLENQVSTLTTQKSSLQSQVSMFQSTLTQKNNLIDDLRDDVDELEADIARISDIVVTQHYEWEYGAGWFPSDWFWDLDISIRTYTEYHFRPRPGTWREWVDMADDPYDDFYITSMIQQINKAAIEEGFTESEKVNFVIAFVQSLPYTVDSATTDWDEYPKYPLETLFERGGDCEDTSILVAALLDRLGYDTCLLFLYNENHCAVGVSIAGTYGSYYEHDGKKYYYLETTGEGFEIGDIPSGITNTRAYIYPINP